MEYTKLNLSLPLHQGCPHCRLLCHPQRPVKSKELSFCQMDIITQHLFVAFIDRYFVVNADVILDHKCFIRPVVKKTSIITIC